MKHITIRGAIYSVLGSLFLLISNSGMALETCQNPIPIWADEFNGQTLDLSKWEVMLGDGCNYGICDWGNNEQQFYQSDNVTVKNGILTITAKKEQSGGKEYTSGRIRSANRPNGGEWTHGRFEAKIKTPNGTGMWPAFWMLPTDPIEGWPISGEIDIMEATGQADMVSFGTIHYGQPWPNNEWSSGRILKQPDAWSDNFHEYAVEWEPNEIRWYIDDILYSVKTPADLSDTSYWTFDNYQYHFLLNLAVGGNIGGVVDDSMLPQTMEIDYVRVYNFGQPAIQGEHLVEANSTHQYKITGVHQEGRSFYRWRAPTGERSRSDSLTVNWGTTGGKIRARLLNSCGPAYVEMDVHVAPTLMVENILDNFETEENLTYIFNSGHFNQTADNPSIETTNGSPTVGAYTRDQYSQWDVLAANTVAITDAKKFITGEKAFYLDIYTEAPIGTDILIQLENNQTATPFNFPIGRHSKYIAQTQSQNTWQRLKFLLDDRMDGGTQDTDITSIILLIAPNSSDGNTYYLDNFTINGLDVEVDKSSKIAN